MDEAMDRLRKYYPLYGDPEDTSNTKGDDRPLPFGEVRILAQALEAAPFLTRRRTEAMVSSLSVLLSRHQAEALLSLALGAPKASNDEELRAMEILRSAMAAPCQITFSARPAMGWDDIPPERFGASPYGLIMQEGRCCLVCNLEGGDGLSILPLAGMVSLRRDATPWRPFPQVHPDAGLPFDARGYAQQQAGFCEGPLQSLCVSCKEGILSAILGRLSPASAPQKQRDGRFLVATEAAVTPELFRWLLSFGAELEVLEPMALREQICQNLRACRALYGA
ncbi:MAG: WYL domain-containing protein [Clostridia bacterium]|nr:WYL domain-containing protein [Clostridia bacterium]